MQNSLFSKDYILKYTLRVLKLGSLIVLSGKIITDLFYPNLLPETKSSKIIYAILGITLIVTGFLNSIILKTKEKLKEHNKQWMAIVHIKFIGSLLVFTPFLKLFVEERTRNIIQFIVLLLFFIISPYMRFYREYYTEVIKSNQPKASLSGGKGN